MKKRTRNLLLMITAIVVVISLLTCGIVYAVGHNEKNTEEAADTKTSAATKEEQPEEPEETEEPEEMVAGGNTIKNVDQESTVSEEEAKKKASRELNLEDYGVIDDETRGKIVDLVTETTNTVEAMLEWSAYPNRHTWPENAAIRTGRRDPSDATTAISDALSLPLYPDWDALVKFLRDQNTDESKKVLKIMQDNNLRDIYENEFVLYACCLCLQELGLDQDFPEVTAYVKDCQQAQKNGKIWVETGDDSLVGKRGPEIWCIQDDKGDPIHNSRYRHLALTVAIAFQCMDVQGVEYVYADTNWCFPINGSIITALPRKSGYTEHGLALVRAIRDKNGKIVQLIGFNVFDNRPMIINKESAIEIYVPGYHPPKNDTPANNDTPGGGGGTPDDTPNDTPDEGTPDDGDTPPDGGGGGTPDDTSKQPKDGEGSKNPSNSAVSQGNAPDTGHTNEDPADKGTPTEEMPDNNDTVVAGSEDSGPREVNDNSDDKRGGEALNGSTDSTETAAPANGSTTPAGETVDSTVNEIDQSVQEVQSGAAEGTQATGNVNTGGRRGDDE